MPDQTLITIEELDVVKREQINYALIPLGFRLAQASAFEDKVDAEDANGHLFPGRDVVTLAKIPLMEQWKRTGEHTEVVPVTADDMEQYLEDGNGNGRRLLAALAPWNMGLVSVPQRLGQEPGPDIVALFNPHTDHLLVANKMAEPNGPQAVVF